MKNGLDFVNKYNTILNSSIDDLVKNIAENNENRDLLEKTIIDKYVKELNNNHLVFSYDFISRLVNDFLDTYGKMVKNYFDTSNIHPIEDGEIEVLKNNIIEMNSILVDTVKGINNFPAYLDLVVKANLLLNKHLVENNGNLNELEEGLEDKIKELATDILNKALGERAADYIKYILPDLYTMADDVNDIIEEINRKKEAAVEVDQSQILAERDAFIAQTMEVEIKEEIVDNVLKLTVTDAEGISQVFKGQEAMDKLRNYNLLFEASRPGRKIDTSYWPEVTEVPDLAANLARQNKTLVVPSGKPIIEEAKDIKSIISPPEMNKGYSASSKNILIPEENNNLSSNNEITIPGASNSPINNIIEDTKVKNNPPTNDEFKPITQDYFATAVSSNPSGVDNSNNSIGNNQIPAMENAHDLSNLNANDNFNTSSGSAFIPVFSNPNQDRNQFIKDATGFIIEEDVDNKGVLYFRVIDPFHKEKIYTGREAVDMIKKYNATYLDANPGKKVDTSLIDNI